MSPLRRVARVSPSGFEPFDLELHPPGELVSDMIARDGVWEPFETSLLPELIGPGDCVLDVGANVGYYTVLAAQRVGRRGRVLALEPDAENFSLLRLNVRHLPQVDARRLALGDTRSTSGLSTNEANRGDLYLTDDGPLKVEVIRGDALDLEHVDLVKIDTQGAEAGIVRGLRQTLARSRTRLSMIVEIWPYGLTRLGDSAQALLEEILALDLPVYLLDHEHEVVRAVGAQELTRLMLETLSVERQGFANVLVSGRLDVKRLLKRPSTPGRNLRSDPRHLRFRSTP